MKNQRRIRRIEKKDTPNRRIDVEQAFLTFVSGIDKIKISLGIVAALLASLVAIITNLEKVRSLIFPTPVQTEQILGTDYWRMTGAFEVPFFLEEGPNIAKCDGKEEHAQNCEYFDTIGEVWRTELKNAVLVDTDVIDTANLHIGLHELWQSTYANDAVDQLYCAIQAMDGGINLDLNRQNVIKRSSIDYYLGEGARSDRFSRPVSESLIEAEGREPPCSGKFASRAVGFLLLRIENHTESPITNIEIEYQVFSVESAHVSSREQSDRMLTDWRALVPKTQIDWVQSTNDGQVKGWLQRTDTIAQRNPDLRARQAALIPIYVYRAQRDGFEDYFYRDWKLPVSIRFEAGGKNYEIDAPLPRRGTGAVIKTYNGWYQQ